MTKSQLEALVASYLHRTDLAGDIPGFIDLATARIGRDLRSTYNEVFEVAAVTADPHPLPADLTNIRSVAFEASRGSVSLRSVGSHELNRYGNSGEPQVYTIRGRFLHIRPFQAQNYELNYWERPGSLTGPTDTNDVLTQYPYLYLYASLFEAYIFLQDEALADSVQRIYQLEIESLNREAAKARTGDAPAMIGVM